MNIFKFITKLSKNAIKKNAQSFFVLTYAIEHYKKSKFLLALVIVSIA